ncbi:MAG: DNA polymerase III subunit delta, partial [Geminicoccales bacterium]
MKITGAQVERFLHAPDPRASTVLVYGPDEGLVRERVDRLIRGVLDDPKDPFRLSELSIDQVRGDPARLPDEARALCLVGGRRVVRLRQASDQASAACRTLLALGAIPALVVIDAGDLGGGSSLRRLIEGAPNGAAVACYRDEGRGLESVIERLLAERRIDAEPEAKDYLTQHLGADRGITRSELDKLALYLDVFDAVPRRATFEDVALVVGDSAALDLDDLVHAAALGRAHALERCLERLLGEGEHPVRLVRSLANHLMRLYRLALRVEGGEPADQVVEGARPPVHFRRKNDFRS